MFQSLADGILIGGVYALIGVALTLVFGVLRLINFAHGDFLMIGLYAAFYSVTTLGLGIYPAAAVVVPSVALLAALAFWVAIRPALKAPETAQLLTTFGLSLVLENAALAGMSAQTRVIQPEGFGSGTLHFLGVSVPTAEILACLASFSVIALLWVFLRRTYPGRLIRAASEDRDAAKLCGIDVTRVFLLTFTLSGSCLGVAAVMVSPFYYVTPEVGPLFTLTAFVVVCIGGLGSFFGALLGGMLVGISEALGTYLLPGSYEMVVMYSVFVLILIFRPTGIFGEGRL